MIIKVESKGDIIPLVGGIVDRAICDYLGRDIWMRDDAIVFLESDFCYYISNLNGIDLMKKADGLKRYYDYLKRKEKGKTFPEKLKSIKERERKRKKKKDVPTN